MKQSGKLSGSNFKVTQNGESKNYSVVEKYSTRTVEVGEDLFEKQTHITRIAFDESGNRAGTIQPGCTGMSYVLNTNNK